jgi:uncharacterized protein YjbJ (UPF0337 family)
LYANEQTSFTLIAYSGVVEHAPIEMSEVMRILRWQFRQWHAEIRRSSAMNWDIVKGNWMQLKGNIQQEWGNLTDDDLDMIAGQREKLLGQLQESYGISKDVAEEKVKDFEARNKS